MDGSTSEGETADTVYQVAHTLVDRGLLRQPEDFSILREGLDEVKPLGAAGSPPRIDLSRLEAAARIDRFWFTGPISGIRLRMQEPILGVFDLGMEKLTFASTLNSLNYRDFEAMTSRLRQLAEEFGLTLAFEKGVEVYEATLIISMDAPLSAASVGDFLDKILLLKNATENL